MPRSARRRRAARARNAHELTQTAEYSLRLRTANGGDTRDRASVRERTEWDVYVDD